MKNRLVVLLTLFAVIIAFYNKANAQYMTKDLILLKIGYLPVSDVTFNENLSDRSISSVAIDGDLESKGYAIQGEYNLIWDFFWLGIGLEYQRLTVQKTPTTYLPIKTMEFHNDFLIPMISAKFAALGGLYIGGGFSGKWLISTEKFDFDSPYLLIKNNKFDKEIDLWVNGIIGYHLSVREGIFLDVEARFGYNITNRQFEMMTQENILNMNTPTTIIYIPEDSYDISFYLGAGIRAIGSNY